MNLLDVVNAPWAIQPERLLEIREIYVTHLRGEKIDLAGVEAKLGRPLANAPKGYDVFDGVAVLPLQGVIAQRANLFMRVSGGTSSQLFARDLKQALEDPAVRAIVLDIDSPGGTVAGTDTVAAQVRAAAQQKPVVAWTDATMASAAYWIGAAADQVFISGNTTTVGSIGVVATHVDMSRAQEAAGVKTTEITAGKYKRIASQYAPLSEEGRQSIQEQVDYLYGAFVDAVAQLRGASAEKVLADMADGRVFIGTQAVSAGLVDGVSSLDALVADLAAGKYQPRRTRMQGAGAALDDPLITSVEEPMKITKELLLEHAPELAAAMRAEGATVERQRIQDVEAQALRGHEALITTLKFDGTTTGPQAAAAVLAAERTARATQAAALAADAPVAQPSVASSTGQHASVADTDAALPVDERCRARWERNADNVKAEFVDLASYTAFERAAGEGRVRILSK